MHTEKDLSTTESLFCCMMRTGQTIPIFRIGTMKDLNRRVFYKNDIYKLADAVQLGDEFVTYNGLIVESIAHFGKE